MKFFELIHIFLVSDRDGVTDTLKILLKSIFLQPITQENCKAYKNDQDNSYAPGFQSKNTHTTIWHFLCPPFFILYYWLFIIFRHGVSRSPRRRPRTSSNGTWRWTRSHNNLLIKKKFGSYSIQRKKKSNGKKSTKKKQKKGNNKAPQNKRRKRN